MCKSPHARQCNIIYTHPAVTDTGTKKKTCRKRKIQGQSGNIYGYKEERRGWCPGRGVNPRRKNRRETLAGGREFDFLLEIKVFLVVILGVWDVDQGGNGRWLGGKGLEEEGTWGGVERYLERDGAEAGCWVLRLYWSGSSFERGSGWFGGFEEFLSEITQLGISLRGHHGERMNVRRYGGVQWYGDMVTSGVPRLH